MSDYIFFKMKKGKKEEEENYSKFEKYSLRVTSPPQESTGEGPFVNLRCPG